MARTLSCTVKPSPKNPKALNVSLNGLSQMELLALHTALSDYAKTSSFAQNVLSYLDNSIRTACPGLVVELEEVEDKPVEYKAPPIRVTIPEENPSFLKNNVKPRYESKTIRGVRCFYMNDVAAANGCEAIDKKMPKWATGLIEPVSGHYRAGVEYAAPDWATCVILES